MKLRYLINPKKGIQDPILTLSYIAVFAATAKFLLDGVTLTLHGQTIDFGHMDSLSYGTLLAPILGAHGYMSVKEPNNKEKDNEAGT